MRPRRVVGGLVVGAGLLGAIPGYAATVEESRYLVSVCVYEIYAQKPRPPHLGHFEAYVSADGTTVYSYGTAEERFRFDKCLAERGGTFGPSVLVQP